MFLLFLCLSLFLKWQTNSMDYLSFVMKSLSISLWNIQGLKSSVFGLKSKNPDFMREIHDLDVIILQETWCRGEESTGCPSGYREMILSSVKLTSTTQGRDSGGIIIWTKSELAIECQKWTVPHVAENKKRHYINISARLSVCHIHTTPWVSLFPRGNFSKYRARNQPFPGPGKCAAYGWLKF